MARAEKIEERPPRLDCLDELIGDLWARWGDIEPGDADALGRWLTSVALVLRAAPTHIAGPAALNLAQRIALTAWTQATEEQAWRWLRYIVWGTNAPGAIR